MNRDRVLRIVTPATTAIALGSVALAFVIRIYYPCLKETVGYGLLGLWALIPPIWFFLEWVLLCKDVGKNESDRIKHLHDLARNIWLALIVVLAAIMGVEWPL